MTGPDRCRMAPAGSTRNRRAIKHSRFHRRFVLLGLAPRSVNLLACQTESACVSVSEVLHDAPQTRSLRNMHVLALSLVFHSRRFDAVDIEAWGGAGSHRRKCRMRSFACQRSCGFEASHVPHVLEWACLTEGRLRCALSRSNTRNGRVRFLPLPVSSIPSFPAGQESLSLAVLHFVSALSVRADRLRSLDCHRGRDGRGTTNTRN